jgi:surface antigen
MTILSRKLLPAALAAALVAACSQDVGVKQTGGAILGGIGGGLAGAQFGKGSGNLAATAIGTLLGAYVGSEVGKSLDKADQAAMTKANDTAQTAPVGQSISWNNPDSGHSGTVTPVRDGTDRATGAYCREYQTTVTVDGKTEKAFGTACRQPDGSWKVVQ